MGLLRVPYDDAGLIGAHVDLLNASQRVDDPEGWPVLAELMALDVRYGWDLRPMEHYLHFAAESARPVGALTMDLPTWDNHHLLWTEITVHPDHRRRGHGSALMTQALHRAREAGRKTVWVKAAAGDAGARAFLEGFGFAYASHDARRRQALAEVDTTRIERLHAEAVAAAADYHLVPVVPPVSDDLLTELTEVSAAINDAPMGTLTFEEERFDLPRLRSIETARALRGESVYWLAARHNRTGEIGGHTVVFIHAQRRFLGHQADTAVSRAHRGHRLGLLLKIEMMRWLAQAEPQLAVIETWNQVDNSVMIRVNEALGYCLSRVLETYELTL